MNAKTVFFLSLIAGGAWFLYKLPLLTCPFNVNDRIEVLGDDGLFHYFTVEQKILQHRETMLYLREEMTGQVPEGFWISCSELRTWTGYKILDAISG